MYLWRFFFIQKEDGVIEIVVEDATNKGRLGDVKISKFVNVFYRTVTVFNEIFIDF